MEVGISHVFGDEETKICTKDMFGGVFLFVSLLSNFFREILFYGSLANYGSVRFTFLDIVNGFEE